MPILRISRGLATPGRVLEYVTREGKAVKVSCQNVVEGDWAFMAKQFTDTMKDFGKGGNYGERKYYHYKLSPMRGECSDADTMQRYAEEIVSAIFPPEVQAVIATHADSKTVHSHIVVNAINPVTGRKLHYAMSDFAAMKDKVNEIGLRYGFSELDFRTRANKRVTSAETHIEASGRLCGKDLIRDVIFDSVAESENTEEFIAAVTGRGVEMPRRGKEYSYKTKDMERAVRGSALGETYKKDTITEVLNGKLSREEFARRCGKHYDAADFGRGAGEGEGVGDADGYGDGGNLLDEEYEFEFGYDGEDEGYNGDVGDALPGYGKVERSGYGPLGDEAPEPRDGGDSAAPEGHGAEDERSASQGVPGPIEGGVQPAYFGADEEYLGTFGDEQEDVYDPAVDDLQEAWRVLDELSRNQRRTREEHERELRKSREEDERDDRFLDRRAEGALREIRERGERIRVGAGKEDDGGDSGTYGKDGGDFSPVPADAGKVPRGNTGSEDESERSRGNVGRDEKGDGGPYKDRY
ncbi:MAG: relaxase/mobilization nuclease domain-containing protein [Bacteroidales bacterium]|nr:relaxase/mobilization nuclease domain-containing protein [Bacteroidales bacterium]